MSIQTLLQQWKDLFNGNRYDKPVVPIVFDDNNDPQFLNALLLNGGGGKTPTLTNIASSATSVTLVSANPNRKGLIVVNDSNETLYLKYGATASSTSYTVKLLTGDTWEMTPHLLYTGIIDGKWSAADGSAMITELN